jgi:hypothetical protein
MVTSIHHPMHLVPIMRHFDKVATLTPYSGDVENTHDLMDP